MSWRHTPWVFNQSITVERNTPTKDASGGMVNSWAAISAATTNIHAYFEDDRENEIGDAGHGQREGHSGFMWYTDVDCTARPGDRVNHGGVYYEIKRVRDAGHDAGVEDVSYEMWTRRVQ